MSNDDIPTQEQFAESVHHSIVGVNGLYTQVAYLFDAIVDGLADESLKPILPTTKGRHFFRSKWKRHVAQPWQGNVFAERNDDDTVEEVDETSDGEEEEEEADEVRSKRASKRKAIELLPGANVLYVKAVLFDGANLKNPVEPYLLYGVFSDVRIGSSNWPSERPFRLKRDVPRNLLVHVQPTLEIRDKHQEFKHVAIAKSQEAPKRSRERRLQFKIPVQPERVPLWEFQSMERVEALVEKMKGMWGDIG